MSGDQLPSARSYKLLSQRERDILLLLAENLADQEIADRLVLAYSTVKWYNRQIFNKLGVENRQQAVERALSLGVLSQTESLNAPSLNLPSQLTPFIGRVPELEALNHLLCDQATRLVTLLAPGGMGKTRLASAAAQNVQEHFAEGLCFVPLVSVPSSDQLISAMSDSLRLQTVADGRSPRQQLLDYLHAKHMLLVLDNFEHLLDATPLILDILQTAPSVKMLVTSRERLNLVGETVYVLAGLPYPTECDGESAYDSSAIELFIACARRANVQFIAHDTTSIRRICQLVQGMPLALELAAGWIEVLSPAEIAAEIERSADFLRTTMRDVPERLRSVRMVFETTWRRLNEHERRTFSRLSVFRGGFTREAGQAVAETNLDTLANLVNKSLLRHQPASGRYETHELLRQYAAQQLEKSGEVESIRDIHCDYFGRFAHEWAVALKTPKQLDALEELEADIDNIRMAFHCAIESGKPEAIEPFIDLWYYYEIRTRYAEAEEIFGRATEKLSGRDSIALGKLLAVQSLLTNRRYNFEPSRIFAEQSIAMLRQLDTEWEMAFALGQLGEALGFFGDLEGQAAAWNEGFELAERYNDQWALSLFEYLLGASAYFRNQIDEAKLRYSEAIRLLRRRGDIWGLGFVLRDFAYLAFEAGDYAQAEELFRETLANARKLHHLLNVSYGLSGLRRVAIAQRSLSQAKGYAEEILQIEREIGSPSGIFTATVSLAEVAAAFHDDALTRLYLREALDMLVDVADPNAIVVFGLVTAPYLPQIDHHIEAVVLLSFLDRQPGLGTFFKFDREKLQKLATQMQSALPSDDYRAAWELGRTLTLDNLLARLHLLV